MTWHLSLSKGCPEPPSFTTNLIFSLGSVSGRIAGSPHKQKISKVKVRLVWIKTQKVCKHMGLVQNLPSSFACEYPQLALRFVRKIYIITLLANAVFSSQTGLAYGVLIAFWNFRLSVKCCLPLSCLPSSGRVWMLCPPSGKLVSSCLPAFVPHRGSLLVISCLHFFLRCGSVRSVLCLRCLLSHRLSSVVFLHVTS